MTFISKAVLLTAALALGACSSNPDRFGSGSGADGADQAALGANDPTSPAYFQETIGDRVLFVVDTWTLTPEAQTVLAGQAQWLLANPEYSAIIEGHADERGTSEYNLGLGASRANSVQDYLVSQGVAANRLKTVSYGKLRPLAICSTEDCYMQNRRSVTVITAGAAS
jgi:peptidoglycan-associated lipoprotein